MNQRKILFFLAQYAPLIDAYHKEMLAQIKLSSSSLARALTALKDKDYVYESGKGYDILDPLIKSVLCL